jgi:hypothetical protein
VLVCHTPTVSDAAMSAGFDRSNHLTLHLQLAKVPGVALPQRHINAGYAVAIRLGPHDRQPVLPL